MLQQYRVKRTATNDKDFQLLVSKLDHELWNELKEDQATYDPFNKVDHIATAVVLYHNSEPVACGCYKELDEQTVEIKRMFVDKVHRGNGLSKQVLKELETWAIEKNYTRAVLETSVHFQTACNLYRGFGYQAIPNYGPYEGLEESVCMGKPLHNHH